MATFPTGVHVITTGHDDPSTGKLWRFDVVLARTAAIDANGMLAFYNATGDFITAVLPQNIIAYTALPFAV